VTTHRFPIAPALVLALTLAVASCGGQPFPEASSAPPPAVTDVAATPRARLLAAAQRAAEVKTARIALDMAVSAQGHPVLTRSGTGTMDVAHQRMTMTVHEVDEGDALDLELRIVGRTGYVLHDATWTSISLAGSGAASLVPDPTSYIVFLQGVAEDVRVVGHETLRGAATTHYAATVDLARALARTANDPARQAVIRNEIALLGNLHIPVSAWVDALGRVRKIVMAIDLTPAAKQLGVAASAAPMMRVSMEMYDFGVPVVVQVPAGAEDALARAQDIKAQSDLRNALTAEKVEYTDAQTYTNDPALLKQIEPSLDWGGKLAVVVGGTGGTAQAVVCLSERAASGTTFALADVAAGPNAGTYYSKVACPASVKESSFRNFRASW
jgi:hypothetical protein